MWNSRKTKNIRNRYCFLTEFLNINCTEISSPLINNIKNYYKRGWNGACSSVALFPYLENLKKIFSTFNRRVFNNFVSSNKVKISL